MDYEKSKNDIGRPIFETFENENLKAIHFILTGETEIEFKPDCDKTVREMWELLKKPYDTKILHKSR